VLLDGGTDPRELEREQAEAKAAAAAEKAANEAAAAARRASEAVTVREAWARYVAERRPHWGERSYLDHLRPLRKADATACAAKARPSPARWRH